MKPLKIVNVIQARLASTRFSEKAFAELNGLKLIDWVFLRCAASALTHETIVAVPSEASSDRLAEHLARRGFPVHRGTVDENDVLGRMLEAAESRDADIVVRTCADRPLIDAGIIDYTLKAFQFDSFRSVVYSHQPDQFIPWDVGFGVEVLTIETLRALSADASTAEAREHVTLLAYEDSSYEVRCATVPAALSQLMVGGRRFDVDTPSDLEKLTHLVRGFDHLVSAQEILLRANQEWTM